jgi:serine/threonine protein kinase/Tol biopolymer transport system component
VVSPPPKLPDRLQFGDDFELDLRAYELRSAGIPIKLNPIPMELLIFLLERRGELITRQQIVDRIWGKAVFLDTDNSINGAVSKIRQVLRDNAEQPRFVQTVTGKGYRFIATVVEVMPASAQAATDPHSPVAESLAGKKVSHYRVLQVLGGGGMGIVYKAEDLKLGRRVAIKFLPAEMASDPKAFGRLEREARAASALEHPNICPIYELGEHEGQPFIVMQLLEGQTLQEKIEGADQKNKPVSVREAVDLALPILAGLEAAHEKGIIHRDIKPANIFITNRSVVKILDFGLAKMIEEETQVQESQDESAPIESAAAAPPTASANLRLTRTGTTVGTAHYMSPEQVRGEAVDPRTDVFSFGLVLYEMATGQRAFPGDTVALVHDSILHREVLPARQANPEIPLGLEQIIARALEKDRSLRYQDAGDLHADLQRLKGEMESATGTVLRAAADSSASVAPTQHHKAVSAVGVLVALVLLVAAGFGLYSLLTRAGPQPFKDFTVTQITNTGKAEMAAISPDGKYILHVQNESGMRSLRLRNILTGSDTQIVAPAPLRYRALVFSPDGNYVYFRQLTNSAGSSWDVYRLPVLGGTPQLIASDVDSDIIFSPDARRVSYVRANDPDDGKFRLLTANPDGTDETILAIEKIEGGGNESYPVFSAWSADGKRIAYSYSNLANQPGVIRSFDLASRQLSPLERLPNSLTFEVHWLRGDRWLMLLRAEKGPNLGSAQIGEVSIADGKFYPLTRDTNSYFTLTLSADEKTAATVQVKTTDTLNLFPAIGQAIQAAAVPASQIEDVDAFDWTTNGELIVSDGSRLLRVGSDGKKQTIVTNDPSAAILSVARCSDEYILVSWAYRGGSDDRTIWRLNIDGSNPKQLSSGHYDTSPSCSPDGKWAYYLDSLRTLMRVPLEGGQAEVVPGSKVPNSYQLLGGVGFSPDGRHMVLIADTHDSSTRAYAKLAIIDLDSTLSTVPRVLDPDSRIAAGSLFTGGAQFSPDGKSVVYVVKDKAANLWVQPLDGSPGHQITNFTSDLISGFRWSPDGKTLAVMRAHRTSDVIVLRETNE